MRNALIRVGIAGFVLLSAACSSKPTTIPLVPPASIATHEEERVSQAPAGTVTAMLNSSQFEKYSEVLLAVSNSTEQAIELPTSAQEDCYAATFWFYAKTAMGWQPRQPVPSFKCFFPRLETGEMIPAGQEKELNIGVILGSRYIDLTEAASYMLRVRYLTPVDQEFLLFTDEFHIGPATPIAEFDVAVENAPSDVLSFNITNNSEQSLWLAPPCSSSQLLTGWMDEGRSSLQRLIDAGSWVPIRATIDDCVQTIDPIEIMPGETRKVDGVQWLQDAGISLMPGLYHWDLVFYLLQTSQGYHVFGDVFAYEN